MALVTRYWVAILVIGCAGVAVAYLPPSARPAPRFYGEWWSYPTPEGRRAKRLHDDLNNARERYQFLHVRDSLLGVLAHRHADRSSEPVLLLSRTLPATLEQSGGAFLDAASPRVTSISSDARIALAFVADTSLSGGTLHFTPAVTDGRTCLTVIPIIAWRLRQQVSLPSLADRRARDVLGPCGFYNTFGRPGAQIERWLAARAFDVASLPDWDRRYFNPLRGDRPTPRALTAAVVQNWFDPQGMGSAGENPLANKAFLELSCALGTGASCRRYLLSDAPVWAWRGRGGSGIAMNLGNRYYTNDADHFCADLVREMGPDRFVRFWRSPLPPDSAFHLAFDVSFDDWAPHWARERAGVVPPSLILRGGELPGSLAWIAVFVGVCVAFVSRRRVS